MKAKARKPKKIKMKTKKTFAKRCKVTGSGKIKTQHNYVSHFAANKSHKQKMLTWQMWIKVLIASVPAGIVGVLFNDILDEIFYKPIPVAVMLIVYGILFIRN